MEISAPDFESHGFAVQIRQVMAWACDVSVSSDELKKRLGAEAPTEGPRALAAGTRGGARIC